MKRPRDVQVAISDLEGTRDLLGKMIQQYADRPEWAEAIRCARADVASALADLKGIGDDDQPPAATE